MKKKEKIKQLKDKVNSLRRYISNLEEKSEITAEKKFATLFENSSDAVFFHDLAGHIFEINPAALTMFGCTKAEMLDRNITDLHSSDCNEIARKAFSEVEEKGQTTFDINMVDINNEIIPCEVSSTLIDVAGIPMVFGIAKDMRAGREAIESLAKSEERFRRLFEDLGDAVFITSIGGENGGSILRVNPAAEKQTGYSSGELIGMNIARDLAVAGSGDFDFDALDQKLRNGKSIMATEKKRKKDGSEYWVEVVITPIDFMGQKACISINRDISRRKQREDELKIFSAAIEQSPASIIITDSDGMIEYVNPKFSIVTGYSSEESFGRNPRFLKGGNKTQDEYRNLWDCIKSGKIWRGEFQNKKKNGELYWEEASIAPIMDSDGKISHFIGIKEDISQRKRSQAEKEILEEQLRRAQKLETIGTLAGGIAHDFNNILTPIMGFTEMAMIEMDTNNQLYQDLDQVVHAAHRARDLIEQILLFSKQGEKERFPLALQPLVKEAMKLLRPSIPSTIEIKSDIDRDCKNILADATQIHQVLVNLCTNSWQAMENNIGVLTIKLQQTTIDNSFSRQYPGLKTGDYARLSIEDTGTGMDEKTRERIFEPFFTTKSTEKGTGLGLSVVHGIVQNHGGEIIVESEPGSGTAFHVYFPIVRQIKSTENQLKDHLQIGTENILVVDDDKSVGSMIRQMLESIGYGVDLFDHSTEALDSFQRNPDQYDMVLTDLTMPEMTGLELAAHLHNLKSDLPVAIFTGYGDALELEVLKKSSISKILKKPISIIELADAVREVLDKKMKKK